MAKKRTVFLPNGDPAFVDKALLKRYPFLERMRAVTTLTNRTTAWQITPKQAADLDYTGYRVQLSYDAKGRIAGLGLIPEDVQVKPGKIIQTGNEYWVSDLALLDKILISESAAKRKYSIQFSARKFKVYLNGKRKSTRYYERSEAGKWSSDESSKARELRLKARYGVEFLPPHWKAYSDKELAGHFELLKRVETGELVPESSVVFPFTFLNTSEKFMLLRQLSGDGIRSPVSHEPFYAPKVDVERLKTAPFIKKIFEHRMDAFLIVYLFNKMGNDFLELLAGELKDTHKIDFHEFM